MKHLTIVIPNGENNMSSIAGAHELFSKANELWRESRSEERFVIQVAGITSAITFSHGLFTITPDTDISSIKSTDLILVPSLDHDVETALIGNEDLIAWITKQYKSGAAVASMCTGTFMLASAGILDGKECSTHWMSADKFQKMFPKVHLQPDKLITDDDGIYTNGGAYSFLNLMIYLIEKYYDRPTAIHCSKIFQIEIDRARQSEFFIFSGQRQHEDEVIQKAQTYIETNFLEKVTADSLASHFNISRRNFDRRFLKATGNTPGEYSQRVKIERAKKEFETNRKTINEVMYDVGYSDLKAFREMFRKYTGMSPVEYKTKYNKEMPGRRAALM